MAEEDVHFVMEEIKSTTSSETDSADLSSKTPILQQNDWVIQFGELKKQNDALIKINQENLEVQRKIISIVQKLLPHAVFLTLSSLFLVSIFVLLYLMA